MHIAFRVDASIQIGTGHVMRCLTLADALCERGTSCTFICRTHSGHLLEMISQRGHQTVALPSLASTAKLMIANTAHAAWLGTDWQTDAQQTSAALGSDSVDWLVVDHYALDHSWEQALRPHYHKLMVIDDLADRPHDCDVLLDQNLGRSAQDYGGLLKPNTATYIGPQYALLRPEFAQLRSQSLARRTQPQLRDLLITMGGVDKDNATGKVLKALSEYHLPPYLRITVVMGQHAPCLADVREQAGQMPWPTQVLVGVNAMAQLMADSDLCIGAAGATSWERCCLGLPTIIIVLAANQRDIAASLESVGAALALDVQHIGERTELSDLIVDQNRLQLMGKCAAEVADGLGAERMTAILLETHKYAHQPTV
jgi:UDP-2,4-diacetamido-2,4,6-trideoxy-beta-L-altropyranose hydrolase